jgi:N-acetylmuramic acid 6-phosphate etherase
MPRARPGSSPRSAPTGKPEDFGALPTEALNPRSSYLDTLPAEEVVKLMAEEEAVTVKAVRARRKEIAAAARLAADKLAQGGRMVYVGAGTSGRLGTLDAAECVPTFGIPPSLAVAIIAGGPTALTDAVEGAEDNVREAEQRMRRAAVGPKDCVICIAASGVTPFVRAALGYAHFRKAGTVFLTCRKLPPAPKGENYADVLIELATGPEIIAGSTRLKAGTATKIALNTISTTAYVLLGKTYGGLMVDVRPSNAKLRARAVRIVRMLSGVDEAEAQDLLDRAGGRAKVALVMHHTKVPESRAKQLLVQHRGSLRAIVGDIDLQG